MARERSLTGNRIFVLGPKLRLGALLEKQLSNLRPAEYGSLPLQSHGRSSFQRLVSEVQTSHPLFVGLSDREYPRGVDKDHNSREEYGESNFAQPPSAMERLWGQVSSFVSPQQSIPYGPLPRLAFLQNSVPRVGPACRPSVHGRAARGRFVPPLHSRERAGNVRSGWRPTRRGRKDPNERSEFRGY